MSLKEKERRKDQQDKFQAILSALLKDEDNKYCVDCDAKGPRWASWNLGIFMCIRCAGIHRNLGVHITRVKSVNLDTWTPEQVAMMQEIGNSRARAAYEANLPDGYRRPQTDSALESFIRAKYEHKKYMAREWVPPQPKVPKELVTDGWLEDKTEKKKPKPKSSLQLSSVPKTNAAPVETRKPQQTVQKPEPSAPAPSQAKVNSLSSDLLGLDLGPPQTNVQQPPPQELVQPSGNNDLLELFGSSQPAGQRAATLPQASNQTNGNGSGLEANLFGDDAGTGEKKASTKDSIMALFGQSTAQPQMYGVPGGMYIPQNQQYPGMVGQPQQQQQQQQGMMGQPQQGMMGQPQQGMMGQPQYQQGMMGQQQGMMGQPQQGMMGQNQGMMGQNQGMMGQNQGMMGQHPGMMGQQPNMMGQQQGMMGAQPNMMMGAQQHMMGQQQASGMMGAGMMNGAQQPGMFNGQGQGQMVGNAGMYQPQQMQQLQYQQMQQKMAQDAHGTTNWGNPSGQTLSNNLWQ